MITRKKTALRTLVILERHRAGPGMIATCLGAAAIAFAMMAATAHSATVSFRDLARLDAVPDGYRITGHTVAQRQWGDTWGAPDAFREMYQGGRNGEQWLLVSAEPAKADVRLVDLVGPGGGGTDPGSPVAPVPLPGAFFAMLGALGFLASLAWRRIVR